MPEPDVPPSFDLVDRVFSRLAEKKDAIGQESLSSEEFVVYYLWASLGLLENGSFQYLVENGLRPLEVARCLVKLDLETTARLFREADELLLREAKSQDWAAQLEALRRREPEFDQLASRILQDSRIIEERLARFIATDPKLAGK